MALATAVEQVLIDKATALHGELCPGLAAGVQVARLAMRELGEDIPFIGVVAVAETDMCGVDAVQAITGCTVGNSNLIILDYGKIGFQFFKNGRAFRVSGQHPWSAEWQTLRRALRDGTATLEERTAYPVKRAAEVDRILSTPPEEMFAVREFKAGSPLTPTVDAWLTCEQCGEDVMESRIRRFEGRVLCIPDYHAATGRS